MPEVELIVIVALIAAAGVALALLGDDRRRHLRDLRRLGWHCDEEPAESVAQGLSLPPFGVGWDRAASEHVSGTTRGGNEFSAFRYRSSQWASAGYVVTVSLPRPLPPAAVGAATPALALTQDTAYGELVASAAAGHLLPGERLTIDHDRLVLLDVPTTTQSLRKALVRLDAVRDAIVEATREVPDGQPPPAGLGVHGHPGWVYLPRHDAALGHIRHTLTGEAHAAHDIITSRQGPVKFLRLTHRWQVRHVTTDEDGATITRLEPQREDLCVFYLGFPFQPMSANCGRGRGQSFADAEFDRRYRIRAADPRFAEAVITPEVMDYLMGHGEASFTIEINGAVYFGDPQSWGPDEVAQEIDFLTGFFARVPDEVYEDLGLAERPVPAPVTA